MNDGLPILASLANESHGTKWEAFAFLPPEGIARLEGAMAPNIHHAWEKAAACEAHARSLKDDQLRDKFRKLRDSWINIANNAQFAGDVGQSEERPATGGASQARHSSSGSA
jgi:hypothetical protein